MEREANEEMNNKPIQNITQRNSQQRTKPNQTKPNQSKLNWTKRRAKHTPHTSNSLNILLVVCYLAACTVEASNDKQVESVNPALAGSWWLLLLTLFYAIPAFCSSIARLLCCSLLLAGMGERIESTIQPYAFQLCVRQYFSFRFESKHFLTFRIHLIMSFSTNSTFPRTVHSIKSNLCNGFRTANLYSALWLGSLISSRSCVVLIPKTG